MCRRIGAISQRGSTRWGIEENGQPESVPDSSGEAVRRSSHFRLSYSQLPSVTLCILLPCVLTIIHKITATECHNSCEGNFCFIYNYEGGFIVCGFEIAFVMDDLADRSVSFTGLNLFLSQTFISNLVLSFVGASCNRGDNVIIILPGLFFWEGLGGRVIMTAGT